MLVQWATVFQPSYFWWWLAFSLTVQTYLLALQHIVFLCHARVLNLGRHCGMGYGEVLAAARAVGDGANRMGWRADVPNTDTTKSLRALAWAFSATQV